MLHRYIRRVKLQVFFSNATLLHLFLMLRKFSVRLSGKLMVSQCVVFLKYWLQLIFVLKPKPNWALNHSRPQPILIKTLTIIQTLATLELLINFALILPAR